MFVALTSMGGEHHSIPTVKKAEEVRGGALMNDAKSLMCEPVIIDENPRGRPRPDTVRGRVITYGSEEDDVGIPTAGIVMELLRRDHWGAVKLVADARTDDDDGGDPVYMFTIARPGEYTVRPRPGQEGLQRFRHPGTREIISVTWGMTFVCDFGLLPRP